ncbi:hypothetical protein BRD19_03200 [Halobacteriales archaeon SW_7_65_23]|nr:MAG: hypothetical protein BRD19_03200 [Halobacteriales archaeon SW_7_65_23]
MTGVVIDEDVRHGKPIVKGTRITVEEILGMLEAGLSFGEIEEEYGLSKEEIKAAIRYVSSFIEGEETGMYA